jgi:hypothetical protein
MKTRKQSSGSHTGIHPYLSKIKEIERISHFSEKIEIKRKGHIKNAGEQEVTISQNGQIIYQCFQE